ncbi:MAG: hypothetical protein ACRYGR_07730, partial [Janthinobacterium lividum]
YKTEHVPLNLCYIRNSFTQNIKDKSLRQSAIDTYYHQLETNLKKYPIHGYWIIRSKDKWEFMGQISLDFSALNRKSTIYTNLLERYQSNGMGTQAREELYAKIIPYVGKEVEVTTTKTIVQGKLTEQEKKLPFVQRKEIISKFSRYQEIVLEKNIFQGVVSAISPYNNFGSLISQIRSGASPSMYSDNSIILSYPKIEVSEIIPQYPLIGELRKIVDEIENRNTRLQGINNYETFFKKM